MQPDGIGLCTIERENMCGRYLFYDDKNETLKRLIEAARKKLPADRFAQVSLYEVFPGQSAFAGIYDPQRGFRTEVMQWGYRSASGRGVINARSETALSASFFAGSSRCAVPASGYYEWSASPHRKYYFTTKNPPLYLAGLWKSDNGSSRFVILTQEAAGEQRRIHTRMPLVLDAATAHDWCRGATLASILPFSSPQLLIREAQNKEPL